MLGDVANRFIQENPNQLEKALSSHRVVKQKSVIIENASRIEKILDDLNSKAKSNTSVLLLGRNHYHRPRAVHGLAKTIYHVVSRVYDVSQ